MTAAMLTELFYCFIALGVLLLLGTFLRAVIPALQKVFLPAAVIGGIVGLILGPTVLNWVPIPTDWVRIWGLVPGLLIVPVFAATPLGMKFGSGKDAGKASADVTRMYSVLMICMAFQVFIGLLTLGIFPRIMPDVDFYPTFGFELFSGYAGGHGTAAVLGGLLRDLGMPFWEISQGVTSTIATIGLVGGMVFGIVLINIAVRRGQTTLLKKPGDLPSEQLKGIEFNESQQASSGKETTYNSSIDSITFHLAVIFLACGISYLILHFARANNVPFFANLAVWTYAILVMFGINFLINKLKLASLVDSKTKFKITGTLTDFAITAAVASLPLQAVMVYIVPILFMCVVGFIVMYAILHILVRPSLTDYHAERKVAMWGVMTGVFITGLMLLKMCDPDFKLPIINNYALSVSFASLSMLTLMPIQINLLINSGILVTFLFQTAFLAAFCILFFIANRAAPKTAAAD